MNRSFFILPVFILTGLVSYCQPEKKLADAFLQSVAKNNFQLLTPYSYNAASAKILFGKEFTKMSPAKQADAVKKYRTRLQQGWKEIVSNARSNKIDFSRVKVKQLLTAPIEGNDLVNSLLITYDYRENEWDDLLLIINKKGATKYITELPTSEMFTLNEERKGRNMQEFRMANDQKDPKIKADLIARIEVLNKLTAAEDIRNLYGHLVYTGEEDNAGRWKRKVDPTKPEDIETAKRLIEDLKSEHLKCDKISYGDVRIEKESEGIWYVITASCGNQNSKYAFLKIDNTYLLGDMD